MDKASKVLRRSSVRLRSMGSGHSELNLAISELKEVRNTAKAFMSAQLSASNELLQWAQAGENAAIQDTFMFLNELNSLWTDTQRDFTEHLKDFKSQFDLILEGEKHVDHARTAVELCDQRENKLKKEIKKSKKCTMEEKQDLEKRLYEAARAKEVAQLEVQDRVRENEAVKMIRVKASLLKVSESYLELANKCKVIFEAYSDVARQLPDVHDEDLQDIHYTGFEASRQAVNRAKESVNQYRRSSHNFVPCAPQPEDPPPPYSLCPPYNPSFVPGATHRLCCAEPSTSYGGGSNSNQRSSSNSRVQTSSSSVNSRPRRRGFFFRTSFRRSDSSGNRVQQRPSDIARPRSMPGPLRATNPFEDDSNREDEQSVRADIAVRSQTVGERLADSLSTTRLS